MLFTTERLHAVVNAFIDVHVTHWFPCPMWGRTVDQDFIRAPVRWVLERHGYEFNDVVFFMSEDMRECYMNREPWNGDEEEVQHLVCIKAPGSNEELVGSLDGGEAPISNIFVKEKPRETTLDTIHGCKHRETAQLMEDFLETYLFNDIELPMSDYDKWCEAEAAAFERSKAEECNACDCNA